MLSGEHLAGAAKPGYHLVADHYHAVLVADLADARPVARIRDLNAVGSGDRLTDEGGDHVRTLMQNGPLQLFGALHVRMRSAIAVRVANVDVARHQRAIVAWPGGSGSAQGHARVSSSVIGATSADDLPAVRLTVVLVIGLGDLQGRLHGLRSAAREVDPGLLVRRQARDFRGELDGRGADRPSRRVAYLLHLLEDRVRDLLPPMAYVLEPHPGQGIDPAIALTVFDPDSLSLRDQLDAGLFRQVRYRPGVGPEVGLT